MMKNKIVQLLEKYEDRIMAYTLGNSVDEYDERYVKVYRYEWGSHKQDIAYIINILIEHGIDINPIGFAYIIIHEWSGVMTFDDGDLNIKELIKVCEDILVDLKIR